MTPVMRGAVVLVLALVLACTGGPSAFAQDAGDPFGPLPQPAQTAEPLPTPTTDPIVEAQKDTDRTVLFAIAGALLVLFLVIGRVITRDARNTLRERGRDETAPGLREEGPHRHAKQTKAKARAKTKAQRQARRQNR
jgi:hypothetical protein